MKSDSLAALEELAEKFSDQSRMLVERERSAIRELDEHHCELVKLNREYQHSIVGRTDTTPQSLEHRRAFVSGLTSKLQELQFQRAQRYQQLEQRLVEHRKRNAQHAALEAMQQRAHSKRRATVARHEQLSMEESARSSRISEAKTQENDHG